MPIFRGTADCQLGLGLVCWHLFIEQRFRTEKLASVHRAKFRNGKLASVHLFTSHG